MNKENQKGMTMIELIVVITIIGIIAAILIPQFSILVQRSRISADVSTVKNLQNQAEMYYVAEGVFPGDVGGVVTADSALASLIAAGYIDQRYIIPASGESPARIDFQTAGASLAYDSSLNRLQLEVSSADLLVYNNSSDISNSWIIGRP